MTRRLTCALKWFVLASVATVATGCTTLRFPKVMSIGADDWSMEAGTLQRMNEVRDTIRTPLRVLWEFDPKAGIRSAPLVRDSIVILGNMRGDLVLFDLVTGKPLGTRSYGLSVEATPALVAYLLFVPLSSEEGIVAVDVKDGSVRWAGKMGPVASSPCIVNEHLVVATLSGKVHCLDRYSGDEIWTFTPSGDRLKPIRSSPAADGGMIFVGADDGRIFAMDAASGSERWTYKAAGSIFATPVVAGSLVVVPCLDSSVYALEKSTGSLRWRFNAGSVFYGPAAADNLNIYVGAGNGQLYCLEAATGRVVWTFSTSSVIDSAPLVTANAVIVGSLDRTLYVLDKASGAELWRFDAPGRLRVSAVFWRGYLIVTSENRVVSVLVPEGGKNP